MTNRPQRSAMCAPSTVQSAVVERPRPGTRKPMIGDAGVDRERQRPDGEPHLGGREAARDPARRAEPAPHRDAQEVPVVAGIVALERPQHEQLRDDLERRVSERERQRTFLERLGNCRRDDEPQQHQNEKQQPHRRALGVEPVGEPGIVDPGPPHREHQDRGLQRAERGEALQQAMRKLRDREHEDEVEEQLDEGDAMVVVAVANAQVAGAGGEHRDQSCPPSPQLSSSAR